MKVEITSEVIECISSLIDYDSHDEMKDFWLYIDGGYNEEVKDTKLEKKFEQWYSDCDYEDIRWSLIGISNIIQEIKKSPHYDSWSEHIAYHKLIALEFILKIKHGGIDIWGEYWEGTSTLNINNFNKQLENSNFGMFSKEGTKRVIDIVKQSKTYLEAIKKLIKLSQEDGFNEAMDTAVRDEVVVCYQVKN